MNDVLLERDVEQLNFSRFFVQNEQNLVAEVIFRNNFHWFFLKCNSFQ